MNSLSRYMVGDIGGTNCRLAVCDPSTGLIDEIRIMPVEDFRSLDEAINTYKDALPSYTFSDASVSIANPITGDRIAMTNAHWDFSIEQTRKSSHLERLIMLNDWESVALSLPILQDSDLERINHRPANGSELRACVWCRHRARRGRPRSSQRRDMGPCRGRGGHVSFSPVDEEESQILNTLMGSHDHVSFEKILSGPGLVGLHQAIAAIDGGSVEKFSSQADRGPRGVAGRSGM